MKTIRTHARHACDCDALSCRFGGGPESVGMRQRRIAMAGMAPLCTERKGDIIHIIGSEGASSCLSPTYFLERNDLTTSPVIRAERQMNRRKTVASPPRYVVLGLFPGPNPEQLGMKLQR